jgi:hypothetical protein
MNANCLAIAAVYALCLGLILIFVELQLPGIVLAIASFTGYLFRYWLLRRMMKAADNLHKTSETCFDEKVAIAASTVMVILGIGLTYILLNHVFDFQPRNFACGAYGPPRRSVSTFECTERMVLTVIYCLTYLSLIAGMWSLARRYLVREHWDDL